MPDDLIDRAQLDLICEECAEEVAAFFLDFLGEFPADFLELRRLAARGDGTALAKLAHRLKGSSSTFGLLRFTGELRALELDAAAGRLPDEPRLAGIERTFAESIGRIREWRPELA